MVANLTFTDHPSQRNSDAYFRLPKWGESMPVLSILLASMIITRRRNFKILGRGGKPPYGIVLDDPYSARSSDELLPDNEANDDDSRGPLAASDHRPKKRNCCSVTVITPNSSRFSKNIHSRILAKFPFLQEMFYWIITSGFHHMTQVVAQAIFTNTRIWDVAQDNGLRIMEFEQFSWLRFLFPLHEHGVQQWFLKYHQTALTALNGFYALIHIPVTVGFIAWYYYVSPSFQTFALVRRTLTLAIFMTFMGFTLYPCMPPHMLPQEYGFVDTVYHEDSQSIWMSGNYVRSLAAMPSIHFSQAFVTGCTLFYHSGAFRRSLEEGEARKSLFWKLWYLFVAVGYPMLVLVTIVATGNHYWMDAVVAIFVAFLAFLCNRILLALLPLEDLLLWALRMEKPIPTTGKRFHP